MKNRKLRKILLTICSAMLLVCLSVGATVAYLTSTDTVTNAFVVGNVKISLDEGLVDANGKHTDSNNDRGDNNTYHLFPGGNYDKDPTIHVDSATEDAWLRLVVKVENATNINRLFDKHTDLTYETLLPGVTKGLKNFTQIKTWIDGSDTRIYIFDYNTKITKSTGNIVLFTNVEIPDDFDNDDMTLLSDTNMTITAYAVQADGFDSCEAAMAAGFGDVFGTAD